MALICFVLMASAGCQKLWLDGTWAMQVTAAPRSAKASARATNNADVQTECTGAEMLTLFESIASVRKGMSNACGGNVPNQTACRR